MCKLRVLNCFAFMAIFVVTVCDSDNSWFDDQPDVGGRFDTDDDGSFSFSHSSSKINFNNKQNLYGSKRKGQRLKNNKNGKASDVYFFLYLYMKYLCVCIGYMYIIYTKSRHNFLISL